MTDGGTTKVTVGTGSCRAIWLSLRQLHRLEREWGRWNININQNLNLNNSISTAEQ